MTGREQQLWQSLPSDKKITKNKGQIYGIIQEGSSWAGYNKTDNAERCFADHR